MLHKNVFLLSLLSISLFSNNSLQTGEPPKNSDTIIHGSNGKWTSQLPSGHTTEINPIAPTTPRGPDIIPNHGRNSSSSSSSSGWGFLGILFNMGKKSARDIERDEVIRSIDKALSKAQSGIPLTSADYKALGTADLSNVQPQMNLPKTPTVFTPICTSVGTPTLAPVTVKMPEVTPTVATVESITEIRPNPKLPTILPDNPFKGLSKPHDNFPSSGGGTGGTAQGAGAIVAGAGMVASTMSTTTAGGATVAGTAAEATTLAATLTTIGSGALIFGAHVFFIGVGVCMLGNYVHIGCYKDEKNTMYL